MSVGDDREAGTPGHVPSAVHDADPRDYPAFIRAMIRHENEVTNHRLMWLLLAQGLTANVYANAWREHADAVGLLAPVGILVSMSAFIMLYKSYQARGYLTFLGGLAKRGALREDQLPLSGWPATRTGGWRRQEWTCRWFRRRGDLLEPYLFLPALLMVCWTTALTRQWVTLDFGGALILATLLAVGSLFVLAFLWDLVETKNEQEP